VVAPERNLQFGAIGVVVFLFMAFCMCSLHCNLENTYAAVKWPRQGVSNSPLACFTAFLLRALKACSRMRFQKDLALAGVLLLL
jgi:hypothetical protein